MLGALEQLMRLHPASHLGRREHHQSDFASFEELESQHLRRTREYEPERGEPTWMLGEAAVAAAALVVFCGVLAVIARLGVDSPDTGQQPLVAVSDAAEPR